MCIRDRFFEKIGWGDKVGVQKTKVKVDQKALKRKKAKLVQEKSRTLKPLKKLVEDIEKQIFATEAELEAREKDILPQLNLESQEAKDYFKESGKLQMKLAQDYQSYEELSAKLEAKTQEYDGKISSLT